MIYSYIIDENLFETTSDRFEIWSEKVNNFFDTIKRNSIWLDCEEEGNLNRLLQKYNELREKLEDELDRKKLEDLWFSYLNDSCLYMQNICSCDNVKNCSTNIMFNNIRQINTTIPSHLIYYQNDLDLTNVSKIDINNYRECEIYKDIQNRSSWQTGPITNDLEGENIIKNIWSGLILNLKDEITILDRNVFEMWNNNFEAGLTQFVNVLNEINPEIKLKIISRKNRNSVDARNNKSAIEGFLENTTSPRIEIIIAERGSLFDHGRFIMFDHVIAGKLERGLDEFHSTNQQDECRVSYWHVDEVQTIFRQAINNQISSGEFRPIRNY